MFAPASERVINHTALYLTPRQAFICLELAAPDGNAGWSNVPCEVTTPHNALQEPARAYRAEKGNVPETKELHRPAKRCPISHNA